MVQLPDGLDARRAMSIGTAGLTSMLCVMALERDGPQPIHRGDLPDRRDRSGRRCRVGRRRDTRRPRLQGRRGERPARGRGLPAIPRRHSRSSLAPSCPRLRRRRSRRSSTRAAIDAVGGTTLATLLRRTRYGGCVAACGLDRRRGPADDGAPLHPPEHHARRRRLGPLPARHCRKVAWERLATELSAGARSSR